MQLHMLTDWLAFPKGTTQKVGRGIGDLLVRRGFAVEIFDKPVARDSDVCSDGPIETAMMESPPPKRKRGRPRKAPIECR